MLKIYAIQTSTVAIKKKTTNWAGRNRVYLPMPDPQSAARLQKKKTLEVS